ncbi:MAG: MerR family transcriptional regulator [Myxococcota bacterium]|jgi:DNA-binding transcriptional MerR regulator/methylmalonyl-CoA mutase cobalamin-binding subunit|nr:MerR family transcriptional regulator [Myxococcota bacterium]
MSVIKPQEEENATLSIGAVSQATGIPVETLRTWERRYGFPSPERSDGGHRQYNASIVEHLNLISRALEQGHRPGQVVGESAEKLGELLDISEHEEERRREAVRHSAEVLDLNANRTRDNQEIIDEWFTQIRRIDHENFPDSLERQWYASSTLEFLDELITPLLHQIGESWYSGELAVLHEQFASNHLRRFLQSQWRPLSDHARGSKLLCATLPGEYHVLGLHMSALVGATAGCQIVSLGLDTDLETIAEVARAHHVNAVLISVSAAAPRTLTRRQLEKLRAMLPAHIELVLGGGGALDVEGTVRMESLDELEIWARQQQQDAEKRS